MYKLKESTKNHQNQLERWLNYEDSIGRKGIDIFNKNGITFVNGNEKADIGISWHGFKVEGMEPKDCILMKNEPPIYYSLFNKKLCDSIYNLKFLATMSSHKLFGFDSYYYNIPRYEFKLTEKYFDVPKDKHLCMILRNKPFSYYINAISKGREYNKKSLLKYRKQMNKMFCKHLGKKYYESYGGPWKGKCYQGEIKSNGKWEIFSKFKFTFCPENSKFDGYVTEKPIQPMCCGSIPIYWGANDVCDYLPAGTYINACGQPFVDLIDMILNMSETEYSKYRDRIKRFITTKESECFSSYKFAENFIKVLKEVKK